MAPEPPCVLLVHLDATDAEIGSRPVATGLSGIDDSSSCLNHRFLVAHEIRDPLCRLWSGRVFLDRRELRELRVAARRASSDGADPLGDFVHV